MSEDFVPHHLNAASADLRGNGGIGRYVLLPGSDGRAEQIAGSFSELRVLPSPRRHNLYVGSLGSEKGRVDVATVATGMGCPSVDIIVQELVKLGARRFLRVGTAGSLQPGRVSVGDLVAATAAVRDEGTSTTYVPAEFPAVASPEMVQAARAAARVLGVEERLHCGIVHTKDSLFAREFGEGPRRDENHRYMQVLEEAGVLASEMEAAHLFVLASVLGRDKPVFAGAVLGIIGEDKPFADKQAAATTVDRAVELALETVRQLAAAER